MTLILDDGKLANLCAGAIYSAFNDYLSEFRTIARRAKSRFENRDWPGRQNDASERLDVYKKAVDQTEAEIKRLLGERFSDKFIWTTTKAEYLLLINARDNRDLAKTFFNSVTRRVFSTVGVNPRIEFIDTGTDEPPASSHQSLYRSYNGSTSSSDLIRAILSDYRFQVGFEDFQRDVRVKSVFYRGQGAYLIGRMFSGTRYTPIVLSLLNTGKGIIVDAVLLHDNEVSILFSFTRSYFHVEEERPFELVRFLNSIMPWKRIAELFIAIGYNKHGKTKLYQDLLHYLANSTDKFKIAEGEEGIVMVVFTIPGYDLVFKVIKDRFAYPKNTTREQVMSKYHLVFKHDRAGRLIDAQEFEHLKFDRRRFENELLEELQHVAAKTVSVTKNHVVIRHTYVERRVVPLDIFVQEADEKRAKKAVVDFGNAIKDLAATNIFPGDMLLKNFGVTRHGRVVFYDYDELCFLTSCNFKVMPRSRSYDEEMYAEPLFSVDEYDVFPEEFKYFLGLQGSLKDIFIEHHADLFEVHFWNRIQNRFKSGDVTHIFPYDQSKRFFIRG